MLIRKELPLDAEDLKKLRNNLIPTMIFPIVVFAMFYFISNFIFDDMGGSFLESGFQWIFIIIGLFFIGAIGYMIWSQISDIKRGIKESIEGAVTDKRLDIKTSTSGGRGKAGTRRTRTSRYYYVYVEAEEFKVDYKYYNRVKTGDRILMERTPRGGTILNLDVISTTDEVTQQEEDRIDRKFLNTAIQEVSLTTKDLAHMERIFKSTFRRKATFMVPLLVFMGWLILSDLGSLLIFFFPMVIFFIFQLIGIIKYVIRYQKSKATGLKEGLTAVVLDKLTVTGNRTKTSHRLVTSWGRLVVSTEIYDALERNEKVVLYKPKGSKKPISIITLAGEVFWLG